MTKFSDNDSPSLLFTEQGSTPTTPAASKQRLFIRTSDHTLCYVNSSGTVTQVAGAAGTAGTSILLTYDLASDISNQATTAGTFFDVIANQNFTVASASSIVEVAIRGVSFFNDTAANQYLCRANIDSAGTPVLKYMGGAINTENPNSRNNPFASASVFVSGLTAATHTIKIQVMSTANDHFFCRASTNGPTTGTEYLQVQVVEHKN